ncbi:DedA family protein [Phytohabitans kaempferiae]|uniref:DedA family protein n=1 Tax=Phytohabitans kaempferiae TaxID=1620943 RepID=A0ABV6M2P2_9ACTN
MSGLEQWLAGTAGWVVYLIVFGVVWAEAAIFAGVFLPGETVLLFGGVLAGLGHVDVAAVMACGVAGAVFGDTVGYQVGRHLGPRLRSTRLGRAVKASRWSRAEAFMRRYGGASVFLGRWIGFGRALVPALAGATRMRYLRFLVWNVLGGVTWAVTTVLVGYLAGGSWRKVESVFGRIVLLIVAAIVVALAVVAVARRVARRPHQE